MAAINQRFILGHAAGTLSAAGVLVHQFDRYTTGLGRQPWALEPEVNHVSCSLINFRVPYTYSPSAAGLVLSPSHTRVKCVYATDGGTHGTPDGCGRRARCTARKWWMCKYPPARLAEMLEAHPGLKAVELWGAEGPGFSEADRALILEAAQRRDITVNLDMVH